MYDLDTLKNEYIGKIFGWLTVLDVVRDIGRPIEFLCICKCGKQIRCRWDKIKSGSRKSCGCYRKSPEMSARKSAWYRDNPEKVKERSEKYSRWCKDNPEKVKEKSDKHRQYNAEHPEKLAETGNKISKTLLSNPKTLEAKKRACEMA